MKILIVTLPLHTNYGGILQAFALQTVLERMGHEVSVWDTPKKRSLPPYKWPVVYPKRMLQYLLKKTEHVFEEQYYNKTYHIKSKYTQVFINRYLHRDVKADLSLFQKGDYDAFVVGSDQIWRPSYNKRIENAYLEFASGWKVKRIAYAASFGTDAWEYTQKQTQTCGQLLQHFDAVAVREASGVDLCKEHFGVQAELVADPTLLIDREVYVGLFKKSQTPVSPGDLLCYVLDESQHTRQCIDKITQLSQLTPFRVNSKIEDKSARLEDQIQPSVEQWLRGFYDAKLIITDSFHACVFSLIFNKPFFVMGNQGRGVSRLQSLLSLFGLENRIITDSSQLTPELISQQLPASVQIKIKQFREQSHTFLTQALSHE